MQLSFIVIGILCDLAFGNSHPHEDANFTQSGNEEDGYLYKIESSLLSHDENADVQHAPRKQKSVKEMLLDLSTSEKKFKESKPIDLAMLGKQAKEADRKIQDIFQSLIEKNKEEERKFNDSLAVLKGNSSESSFVSAFQGNAQSSFMETEKGSSAPATTESSYDQTFDTIRQSLDHMDKEHTAALKAINSSESSFAELGESTHRDKASWIEKKSESNLEGLIHSLNPIPRKGMSLAERIKAEENTASSLEKKYHFTLPKWIQEIQDWAHQVGKNGTPQEPAVPPASLGQIKIQKDVKPLSFGKDLLLGTSLDPQINTAAGGIYDSEYDKIMAQEKVKRDVADGKLPFRPGENWKPKTFDQVMKERAWKMQMGDPDPHVSTGTFYLQTEHKDEEKAVTFDFDSIKKNIDQISTSLMQHMKPLPFHPGKNWHPKIPSEEELAKVRDEATKESEGDLFKKKPFSSFIELSDSNKTNNASSDSSPILTSFTETAKRRHHRRHHRRRKYNDDDDDDEDNNVDEDESSVDEDSGDNDDEKLEASLINRRDKVTARNVYSAEAQKNLEFPVSEMEPVHFKTPKWKPLPFSTDELLKRFKKKWESGSSPNMGETLVPEDDAAFLQIASDHKDAEVTPHVQDFLAEEKKSADDVLGPFRDLKITPQSLMQPWSFGVPTLGVRPEKSSFIEEKGMKAAMSSRDKYRAKLNSMSLSELEKEKESVFSKLDNMLKHPHHVQLPSSTSFLEKHHKHHQDSSFKPVPISLSYVDGSTSPSSFVQDDASTDMDGDSGSLADLADTLKASQTTQEPVSDGPNFADDPSNPLQEEPAPISSFSSMEDPYATLKVPRNQNPFAMEGGEHIDIKGTPPSFLDALPNSPAEAAQLLNKTFVDETSFLQEKQQTASTSKILNTAEMQEVQGVISKMEKAATEKIKVTDPFKVPNPAIKLLADIEKERAHRKKRLEEMDAMRARGEDPGLFSSDGYKNSFLEISDGHKTNSESSMLQAMKGMEDAALSESNAMNKVTRRFHALEAQLDGVLGKHEADNLPAALKHLPPNGGVTDHHLKALEKLKSLEIKERPSGSREAGMHF